MQRLEGVQMRVSMVYFLEQSSVFSSAFFGNPESEADSSTPVFWWQVVCFGVCINQTICNLRALHFAALNPISQAMPYMSLQNTNTIIFRS